MTRPVSAALAIGLAKALVDLFPKTVIFDTYADEYRFACSFSTPTDPHPDLVVLVEEYLRGWLKGGARVERVTMGVKGARHYFLDREQPHWIGELAAWSAEVPCARIGQFYALYTACPTEELLPRMDVKVIAYKNGWIEGVAFTDSQELKKYIKKIKNLEKNDTLKIAQNSQWIKENLVLPKGYALEEKLFGLWRHITGLTPLGGPQADLEILRERHWEIGSWLKNTHIGSWRACDSMDICHHLTLSHSTLISSLQSIRKVASMLGLNGTWVLAATSDVVSDAETNSGKLLREALVFCGEPFEEDCYAGPPTAWFQVHDAAGSWILGWKKEGFCPPFVRPIVFDGCSMVEYSLLGSLVRYIDCAAAVFLETV